jgi:hypothetical protein
MRRNRRQRRHMQESKHMSRKPSSPEFSAFTAWLAREVGASASKEAADPEGPRYPPLLAAARAARDETSSRAMTRAPVGHLEVLELLAAAEKSESSRPPELRTARGFRVTLAYDESGRPSVSSICVLVHCPPELIASVQGQTAYLWSGTERFELGQFDAEGKAIGTLPAGIEISLSDFTQGKVKLEEPPSSTGE